MVDLLQHYSIEQILIIGIGFTLTAIAVIKWIGDFAKGFLKFLNEYAAKKEHQDKIKETLDEVQTQYKEMGKRQDAFESKLMTIADNVQSILDQMTSQNITQTNSIEDIRLKQDQLADNINKFSEKVNTLMGSDKEDIKSFILTQHKIYKGQGFIDTLSLQCLESRYEYYRKENGNSFVAALMEDIRKLPIHD